MKRLVSLVLCLAVVFLVMPVRKVAAYYYTQGYFQYVTNFDETATIVGHEASIGDYSFDYCRNLSCSKESQNSFSVFLLPFARDLSSNIKERSTKSALFGTMSIPLRMTIFLRNSSTSSDVL